MTSTKLLVECIQLLRTHYQNTQMAEMLEYQLFHDTSKEERLFVALDILKKFLTPVTPTPFHHTDVLSQMPPPEFLPPVMPPIKSKLLVPDRMLWRNYIAALPPNMYSTVYEMARTASYVVYLYYNIEGEKIHRKLNVNICATFERVDFQWMLPVAKNLEITYMLAQSKHPSYKIKRVIIQVEGYAYNVVIYLKKREK